MAFKSLVVDDEIDPRYLMARRFRREIRDGEFVFKFAADGVEPRKKLRNGSEGGAGIDLVPTGDYALPGRNGKLAVFTANSHLVSHSATRT